MLIVLPLVHAEWYFPGDEINNATLYVKEDYSQVKFGNIVLNMGECKEVGLVKYCYERYSNLTNNEPYTYINRKLVYGIMITNESLIPDVDLTIPSEISMALGEEKNITIKIRASKNISNVELILDIPPNIVGEKYFYLGNIKEKDITLTLRQLNLLSSTIHLLLKYSVKGETFLVKRDIRVNAIRPYNYTIDYPESVKEGECFNITINVDAPYYKVYINNKEVNVTKQYCNQTNFNIEIYMNGSNWEKDIKKVIRIKRISENESVSIQKEDTSKRSSKNKSEEELSWITKFLRWLSNLFS